ncbi:MAG: hypothetical protein M1816_004511 [Peltula sp. TS41687]|nr:MAG: hypothetical protein M1816_004511 [Peltula sp. TS41687]
MATSMPSRLKAPVLTVDAAEMRKVDPRNVGTLYGMWTVFSRCAEAMEEGRRYENLSWRLWNRETFCCSSQTSVPSSPSRSSRPPRVQRARQEAEEVPELSASVESAMSDQQDDNEEEEQDSSMGSRSAPLDIEQPRIRRLDSFESRSRGREKHITSFHLERMFTGIKATKELEPLSLSASMSHLTQSQHLRRTPSTRTTDVTPRPTSVVLSVPPPSVDVSPPDTREMFEVGVIRESASSESKATDPMPSKEEPRRKNNVFMLGGSSGEDESSLEDHMQILPLPQPQQYYHSSLSDGLKQNMPRKKQTSFKEEVATRTINESMPLEEDEMLTDDDEVDDDDEDVVSESAIDDDDSSDWDSVSESGRSSVDEKPMFQRVDSKLNLTSRRSLLTNLLHGPQRAAAFAQQAASQSTSALNRPRTTGPNGPSVDLSPEQRSTLEMRGSGVPRSKPIGLPTSSRSHPPVLSPRTTRRNMLGTELTESLRKHLLWERQHKNTTANALKRRHTAHDVANLQEYPNEKHGANNSKEGSKNNSWNHYFDVGLGEYHSKGW